MTYNEWKQRHPQAASELEGMLSGIPEPKGAEGKSEAWAQQQARLSIAKQGAKAWRNNVGGTKTREQRQCPACQFRYVENVPPMRWGLANDSAKLNKVVKSSDLILAIPRLIQPHHVGQTIAQFGSVETKRPGWSYNPNDEHQAAQAKWLQLVASIGGFACFSTGSVDLGN